MGVKLQQLKEIGFSKAGKWHLNNGELQFDLNQAAKAKNVLYAFVVENELVYVGKTLKTLNSRLTGYKKPGASQSTNIKNNKNIRNRLKLGERVEIYVLIDTGLLKFGTFHLNLAAGLEDSLIRELEPLWNGGKKEKPDMSLAPTQIPSTVFQNSKIKEQNGADSEEFRNELLAMFSKAEGTGAGSLQVNAGELHRKVGGYPGSKNRMPTCCAVMRRMMQPSDVVLKTPPKGNGASLTILYALPRVR